jgi:hypothetical protein
MSGLLVWLINLAGGLWKKPPVLAVLVINLIPAACVLWFGWSALALLLLYWAENVILGLINVAKMIVVAFAEGISGVLTAIFVVPFFIIHYGAFCAGHLLIAVMLVGGLAGASQDPMLAARFVWDERWNYVGPLLAMTAFHLAAFVQWLRAGAFRGAAVNTQMGEPYGRIVIMHITVLAGAFLIVATHQPAAAVALLAVLKTLFEGAWAAKKLDDEGKPIVTAKRV